MSNNPFSKKFVEILGKMDEKVLKTKLNAAMDMLKKGELEELVKNVNKMDKKELLNKIEELDEEKLKKLQINKQDIKNKVSEQDFRNLADMLGEQGNEIVEKIKEMLN